MEGRKQRGAAGYSCAHNSPCRAMMSTSITAQPSCWNTWITELLPEAMPPVRPTRNIFPGRREVGETKNQESGVTGAKLPSGEGPPQGFTFYFNALEKETATTQVFLPRES